MLTEMAGFEAFDAALTGGLGKWRKLYAKQGSINL